jgi:hypothetical protein
MAKDFRIPGMDKHDGSYMDKVRRNEREEAAARVKQGDFIPGARKNRASYEEKTLRNPKTPDKALKDTRVLDEEYDYTKKKWPGHMEPDLDLDRGVTMQIKHKPLTNSDTNE